MRHTLDRSRPVGHVIGLTGAVYEQDGRLFNPKGEEVDRDGHPIEPLPAESSSIPPAALAKPSLPEVASFMPAETPAALVATGLAGLHWRELKALVESYGGTWTNKKEALTFLEGRS